MWVEPEGGAYITILHLITNILIAFQNIYDRDKTCTDDGDNTGLSLKQRNNAKKILDKNKSITAQETTTKLWSHLSRVSKTIVESLDSGEQDNSQMTDIRDSAKIC